MKPNLSVEPARKYSQCQTYRLIILSNGNLHYFWDLERGKPHLIGRTPGRIG